MRAPTGPTAEAKRRSASASGWRRWPFSISAEYSTSQLRAAAMSKLRVKERAMLWLAYGQGASHEEIARVVGVRTGSIKPLLLRARRRMAMLLGGADREAK